MESFFCFFFVLSFFPNLRIYINAGVGDYVEKRGTGYAVDVTYNNIL